LGTAEFYKDSDKKLRQSEGNMLSWLTGKTMISNTLTPTTSGSILMMELSMKKH
jgi:hypothetical protein